MANILVLGAGELGTPILHHLIAGRKPGTSISLVVRPSTLADPESSQSSLAKYLVANDVTRIGADINRATTEELATLFRSHDTVVSASGMTAPPGTQLKLAHAVLEAGVSRYVPWQFGLDYDAIGKGGAQDLFDEQLDVRALLRAQKRTEWAIISTGIFMTFLFEDAFGVVEGLRASVQPTVKALGDWDNKVTYTHPEDIGRGKSYLSLCNARASPTSDHCSSDASSATATSMYIVRHDWNSPANISACIDRNGSPRRMARSEERDSICRW